jgi:DHA1 family tetracycline resistance protein-like MFS transporter
VGLLFTYMGVVSSLTQGGLVGRLVRRFGEGSLILTGSSCMAIGLGLLSVALHPALLLPALALLALGQGLASPVLISVLSLLGETEEQGETLGVSQALSSLARILGPLWGGWMYDTLGPTGPYTTGSGVLVGAVLLSLILVRAPVTSGAKTEAKETVEG